VFKHDGSNLSAGRSWLAKGQGHAGVPARLAPPTTSAGAPAAAKLLTVESYHDQSMAEGVRVQIVLPPSVAQALRQRAAAEKRTVSSLGGYLIESGLQGLPPLPEAC
jgi:hypothetical protein